MRIAPMTRFIWLVLLVCCSGIPGQDSASQLRQGAFLTERQAREELAEFSGTFCTREEWEARSRRIRRGILRGMELDPLPDRCDLRPLYFDKRIYKGYTVENVAFESLPGIFVTGNLYRPVDAGEKIPAVLCPHGHFEGGRFRPDQQIRCATLARMGAIVLSYDMFGWGESDQIEDYRFPESHKEHPYALKIQTWNSMRAADFLLFLPEVDPSRIAITAASGGGTQTIMLAALDQRISVSVPVVMVSAHFFGGCICESGMPIHHSSDHLTNNAEIAALMAPRPQLLISCGQDWTRNTPEVEFPYFQKVYYLYNAWDQVENVHFEEEGHDYGFSKRQAMYVFLARIFSLSLDGLKRVDGQVDELPVVIEEPDRMRVFTPRHPRPSPAVRFSKSSFRIEYEGIPNK